MRRTAQRAITDQTGAALILAMVVLMIVTGIVAAAVAVAVQTNGSTRRDADKKNALEAAEAGLQVANYRINMLQPDGTHCVGDGVTAGNALGMCASTTATLGNGATYSYYTSVPIGPGTAFPNAKCVGLTITTAQALNQRCITATGTANGVTARSQIRVAAFAGTPYFPIPGITGWKSLFFKGGTNTNIQAVAASNYTVTQNNGSDVQGVMLGPPGIFTNGNQLPPPPVSYQDHPITLSAVPPTTSAINASAGGSCIPPQPAPPTWVQTNCDYMLTNGTDQSSGFSYDPVNRILKTTKNNATLTLHGTIYNFCEFDASNNATITLTQKTVIYIDSPYDPNSGVAGSNSNPACNASRGGAGNLNLSNNVTWNNVFA